MKKMMILAALLIVSMGAMAQEKERDCIEVTGRYTLKVQPDIINLRITIDEAATKGKTNLEEVEKKMLSTLTTIGVDTKKDLKMLTSESSLTKKKMLSSRSYQLVAHDAESVQVIFAALDEIGITSIEIESTTHSRLKELQSDARKKAMEDAKAKATDLAETVGQTVGRAFYIRDDGGQDYVDYSPRLYMMKAANSVSLEDEAVGQPIESKDIEIKYNVYVKFELK